MSQQKESLDLMNVEYEDVLHLYRGWRKSESQLKDKTQELQSVRDRLKQLQESHVKFRNQIQSLESVKNLTVSLKGQLVEVQQENAQLGEENKELAQLNMRADELLREKEQRESEQAKMLQEIQLEFATLRGRYEENLKTQRELEQQLIEEQSLRIATESRLQATGETVNEFKEENRNLQHKLETAELKLNQCDHELQHASEQLKSLSREVTDIQSTRESLYTKEAELGLLKGDIARLLHLLECSSATRGFINQWQNSSGGMSFVGADSNSNSNHSTSHSHAHSHSSMSAVAVDSSATDMDPAPAYSHLTADTSMMHTFDLTPAEFAHLKRVHGGDPFPMTDNMMDEAEYWVPSDAAQLGLQFLTEKIPHASPRVIMDFLRSMNKIWLRRERRKVKRVKQVMGGSIEDLKRQLSQSRPYKGVIAERQIRRLKNQVKGERSRSLKGRPRRELEDINAVGKFEYEDQLDSRHDHSSAAAHNERRLCRITDRARNAQPADVTVISTERLLEASLYSLESMGRHMQTAGNTSSGGGSYYDEDSGISAGMHNLSLQSSMLQNQQLQYQQSQRYPNDSYLRGALWLGRNMTVVSEELSEEMNQFRTKFLAEVAMAAQDSDVRRAGHRLTLLANSGITQAHGLSSKARTRIRNILQGASGLVAGDAEAFKRFLRTLPIESALTKSDTDGSAAKAVQDLKRNYIDDDNDVAEGTGLGIADRSNRHSSSSSGQIFQFTGGKDPTRSTRSAPGSADRSAISMRTPLFTSVMS